MGTVYQKRNKNATIYIKKYRQNIQSPKKGHSWTESAGYDKMNYREELKMNAEKRAETGEHEGEIRKAKVQNPRFILLRE